MKSNNKNEKGYCTVYTKFTENYRLSQPIQMGEQLQSVHNQDGADEFFYLRTDGYVESFFTDINSSTGYKNETIHLQGSLISSICCQNGDIIIFASQAEELYYVKKVKGSVSYSEPKKVNISLPYNAYEIENISVKQIGDNIWILVLMKADTEKEKLDIYAMCGKWQGDSTLISSTGFIVNSNVCTWLTSDVLDPIFVIAGTRITGINAVSGNLIELPQLPVSSSCSKIDAVYDDINKYDVMAVINNNDVYVLLNNTGCVWVKTDQEIKVEEVYLYNEINFGIHIFCRSLENRVVHGYITVEEEDLFREISPLISNCDDFCITYRNNTSPSLFCNNSDNELVNYFLLEKESRNWNVQEITLPSDNDILKYDSYMSEITAYDSYGLIYPNASIKVWSKEDTRIEVNGNVVIVGPNKVIDLKTNANGVISISQETQTLSVPDLCVSFISDNGPPTEDVATLNIYQYAPVEKILKYITGDRLIKATKNDGLLY